MARVEIKEIREQAAHYGLHRQGLGTADAMIIRRKVGEPTDYQHTSSTKLKRQRDLLTKASQHYARLTPSQKAITRHQLEEVPYIKHGKKSDTKLLSGRQLFISQDMHSMAQQGQPLALPMELCIMLVDPAMNPLTGELWLRYLKDEEWLECSKEQLATGNWLFPQVPPAQQAYRPYGEASGYYDPQLPEYQYMNGAEIKAYHYHCLIPLLLFEHQLEWNDWGNFCQYWNACAQLFTPTETHLIYAVDVLLANWEAITKGPFAVTIETAEDDPLPGQLLAEMSDHSDNLNLYPNPTWKRYLLPAPLTVYADQPYRLVVHTTPGWEAWRDDHWEPAEHLAAMRWAAHVNADQYPRGYYEYGRNYRDGTGDWQHGEGQDMAFAELGAYA